MRALTAVLYIDDSKPAPLAGLEIELDGQPMLNQADVPPGDWIAVVDALGQGVGVDLRAELSGPLAALLEQLQAQVEQGRADQQAREDALAAWQQVAPSPDPE